MHGKEIVECDTEMGALRFVCSSGDDCGNLGMCRRMGTFWCTVPGTLGDMGLLGVDCIHDLVYPPVNSVVLLRDSGGLGSDTNIFAVVVHSTEPHGR